MRASAVDAHVRGRNGDAQLVDGRVRKGGPRLAGLDVDALRTLDERRCRRVSRARQTLCHPGSLRHLRGTASSATETSTSQKEAHALSIDKPE
jgi:hypothetical protein